MLTSPLRRCAGVLLLAFVLHPAGPAAGQSLPVRTNETAGVRVAVTPKAVAPGAAAWEFDVVLDTHTKPLNDDMAKAAVLVDDAGGRRTPLSWQGDPPGGHHRKGTLRFPAAAERPGAIELQLSGIGGAGLRSFRWELK